MASSTSVAAQGAAAGVRSRGRARLLVFPREHGAWGILLVPLVAGGWMGYQPGSLGPLLLFTVAVLALFLLRTPLEAWLGGAAIRAHTAAERALARKAAGLYALLAMLAGFTLLRHGPAAGLLWLGMVAALCGFAQAGLRRLRRETRVPAQVIGAVGLTATAPGAYYVAAGALDQTAYVLWLVNWLFAAHQIHYVHLRIGAAKARTRPEKFRAGRGFVITQSVLLGGLAGVAAASYAPPMLFLAFIPALVRAAVWFQQPQGTLSVRRLGFSELAQNIAFGVLVIVTLQVG